MALFGSHGDAEPAECIVMQALRAFLGQEMCSPPKAVVCIPVHQPRLAQTAEGGGGVGRRQPYPKGEFADGGWALDEFVEDASLVARSNP